MLIVETPVFMRRVLKLMSDEDIESSNRRWWVIQNVARSFVTAADYERSVGRALVGANEVVRAIYYWARSHEILLMLLVYGKNEQDDLTPEQLRILRALVEKEFK